MEQDIQLIESAQNGDQLAFEELIKKYKGLVYNLCYSMLNNRAEAEEVSQEVFIKLYYSLSSFEQRSSFSTWVYRIGVNECLQKIRRQKHHLSLDDETIQSELTPLKERLKEDQDDLENKVLQEELRDVLKKIITRLPTKYRMVLVLKEIENLSYLEMALALNISLDKVKVWLFRARKKLRERFKPYWQGGN